MADITVETLRIDIDTNAAEAEKKIKSLKSAVDDVSKKTAVASVEPKGVERTTTAFAEMRRRVDHVNKSSNLLKKTLDKISSGIKFLYSRMNLFSGMGSGIGKLSSSLKRVAFYRAIRSTIKAVTQGVKEGMQNLYRYSEYFGTQFKKSLDSMATSALYVKNSLATIAEPIVNSLAPVIDMLADKFADFSATVAEFLAALTGSSTYTRALKFPKEYAEAANGAAKATQKWLGPFDEINRLSAPSGSGSGESLDYSKMFETLEVTADSPMTRFIDRLKDGIKNGDLSDIGKYLSDKLSLTLQNIDWTKIKEKAALIGSSIGSFINGGLAEGDILPTLGTTFGEVLNTVTTFSRSIREKLDFKGIGEKLGEGISNFFKTFKLGDALNEASRWARGLVKGISATIKTMVENGSFKDIGKEIGEAVADILSDVEFWKTILIDLPGAILEAVGQLTSGLTEGILERLGIDKNTSESAGGVFGALAQTGVVAMLLKKLGLLSLGSGAAGASVTAGATLSGVSSISLLGTVTLAAGAIYMLGKTASSGFEAIDAQKALIEALDRQMKADEALYEAVTGERIHDEPGGGGRSFATSHGGGASFDMEPFEWENFMPDGFDAFFSRVIEDFTETQQAAKEYEKNVPKSIAATDKKVKSSSANTWKETRIATKIELGDTVDYIGKETQGISVLVGDGFSKAAEKGKSGAKALSDSVKAGSLGISNEIVSQLNGINTSADNAFKTSTQTSKSGIYAMKEGIRGAVVGLTDIVGTEVGKIADKTREKLGIAKESGKNGAKAVVVSIGEEFNALKEATDKKTAPIADSVKKNIENAKKIAISSAKDVVRSYGVEIELVKDATDKKTSGLGEIVKKHIGGISTTINGDLVTVHNKISGSFQGAASNVKTYLDNMDTNMKNTMNNMVSNAKNAQKEINKMGTNSVIKDFDGRSAITTKPSPIALYGYANGGFVDSQLFFARENGAPELVGQIGNRTAVANNAQIVAGISEGVEDANMGVINAIYAMAGQIVNAIKSQGGNGRIDWDGITRQISRTQARQAVSANI